MNTTFQDALGKAIDSAIAKAKKEGTVQMSVSNLRQIVSPPSPALQGAPCNQASYNRVFETVVNEKASRRRFVYESK